MRLRERFLNSVDICSHFKQTLGVRSGIPIPVTFFANVYLDYNVNCEIKKVRAVATIPTEVLGLLFTYINVGLPLGL